MWTTQNHSQFPADFQQKVAAVVLAWQLPLVPFNKKPGDLVQQVAEASTPRWGCRNAAVRSRVCQGAKRGGT